MAYRYCRASKLTDCNAPADFGSSYCGSCLSILRDRAKAASHSCQVPTLPEDD